MNELTQKELKRLLNYDENTGIFTWLVSRRSDLIGKESGTMDNGYMRININRKLYLSHRLAWMYVYGYMPKNMIDHINHIRNDNRIINLREATNLQNQKNTTKRKDNKSGFTGVSWNKRNKTWGVNINVDNKRVHLGSFDDLYEAIEVRKAANIKYGYHPNHG